MSVALIMLLGNRDVQVPKKSADELKNRYTRHLIENNEGGAEYLIINKAQGREASFLEVSRMMWEEIEYFYPFADYPMLNATLNIIADNAASVNKVYLSTSRQIPPHYQDACYFAEIIKHHLEKQGITCELRLCSDNPNNFSKMVDFYTALFDEVGAEFGKVFVSNSGGTPNMRSASHFAGIFRGFEYITISADDQANLQSFKKQEHLILANIIKSMLNVFDYEGIVQLPTGNEKVKALARYAMARIALNFKVAKREIEPLIEDNPFFRSLVAELEEQPTVKKLEKETFLSAKIKFHQKSYTDYLWRLFTIHDNLLIPIVENIFQAPIIYNKKSDFQEWKDMLAQDTPLMAYLCEQTLMDKPLAWEIPNKFVYKAIFDHYYPKGTPERLLYVDDIDKCLSCLSELRNVVAHEFGFSQHRGFEGIGIEEMEKALPKKYTMADLNHIISSFIGLEWSDFGVYGQINEWILEHLS